jgi:hypothetical protein
MRSLDEQVWIKAAGVSARTLQKWLGHASLETTLAYLEAADIRSERTRRASEQQFRGAAGGTGYGDRARLLRGEGDLPSSRALTAWRVIAVGSLAKLFSVLA